jgi:hypothetical protein
MAEVSPRRGYTLAILLAVYACNFMDRQILAILKPAINVTPPQGDGVGPAEDSARTPRP